MFHQKLSQYNNGEIESTVVPILGESIDIMYLRTGYVDKYDSTNTVKIGSELSLSSNKAGCGEAYIYFKPRKAVKYIFIELAYWSAGEGATSVDNIRHTKIISGNQFIIL